MRRLALLVCAPLVLGSVLLGCNRPAEAPAADPSKTSTTTGEADADPAVRVFEQLRAGAYQLDVAMGAMQRAMNKVRPLVKGQPEETKEALQNIADMLDSAGATMVDFVVPPEQDAVRADFATHDDRRLKAITESNDARMEVQQAEGTVRDMLDSEPPAEMRQELEAILNAIEEALDGIEEAIEAFGGKIEEPGEEAP